MDNLDKRFRVFDGVRAPDLWSEIVRRAEAGPASAVSGAGVRWRQPSPAARPLISGLVAIGAVATLIAGLLVVGPLLNGSGLVPGASPTPTVTPSLAVSPSPSAPAASPTPPALVETSCVTPVGFTPGSTLWPLVIIDRSGLVEGCRRLATPLDWWPGQPGLHGPVSFDVAQDGSGIELAWVVSNCDVAASVEVIAEDNHLTLTVGQTRSGICAPGTGLRAVKIELPADALAGAIVDMVWIDSAP